MDLSFVGQLLSSVLTPSILAGIFLLAIAAPLRRLLYALRLKTLADAARLSEADAQGNVASLLGDELNTIARAWQRDASEVSGPGRWLVIGSSAVVIVAITGAALRVGSEMPSRLELLVWNWNASFVDAVLSAGTAVALGGLLLALVSVGWIVLTRARAMVSGPADRSSPGFQRYVLGLSIAAACVVLSAVSYLGDKKPVQPELGPEISRAQ